MSTRKQALARTRRLPLARIVIMVVMLVAMHVPAVFAHEPVFALGVGMRAAAVGAALGLAIAVLSALFRWHWGATVGVAVIAYLLCGGAAALPETTGGGMLPSIDTLTLLVVQTANAWKDLLTLIPPAYPFVGPSVLPYFTGMVSGLMAGLAAMHGRWLIATIPPVLWYVVGAMWSVPYAPHALWLGIVLIAAVSGWLAFAAGWERADRGADIAIGEDARAAARGAASDLSESTFLGQTVTADRTMHGRRIVAGPLRRILAAVGTIGIGVLIAALAAPAWIGDAPRTVLRNYVAPPLMVQELPTPLERFRHLSADLVDDELIRVEGLPKGARLRFAAMNQYDGVRWGIAEPKTGEGFLQIGEVVSTADRAPRTQGARDYGATVQLHEPVSRWVPTIGHLEQVQVGNDAVAASLFYDLQLRTAVSGASVPDDMVVEIEGWAEPNWTEAQLSGLGFGDSPVPPADQLPENIAALASSITAAATSPLDRVRTLERYFRDGGYYANGIDYPSAPGHTKSRIAELIDSEQMIGDDEQYATAMALAAQTLGIPARVVVGAYPEEGGEGSVVLRGADVHAWVEVEFAEVGWVPFDPTPPKDHTPQTELPEPRSVPQPQVLQPPEPPKEPPQLPSEFEDREVDDPVQPTEPFPWMMVGGGSTLLLLLLTPILGVPLYKWWRRRRRRRAQGREGVRGAWYEAEDYAVDAGYSPPPAGTALEHAQLLETERPLNGRALTLAAEIGAAEFSGREVGSVEVERAWAAERELRDALAPAGIWNRHRVRMSWRTLRARNRRARRTRANRSRQRKPKGRGR